MARVRTTDKMLQAVLSDERLRALGGYDDTGGITIDEALTSDNYIIRAVGLIIDRTKTGSSDTEIYREVSEFLKQNV